MPALPDPELSRAVLIGTSRFDHLTDLPAVQNNLVDLRAALTDSEHGVIAPGNCLIVEEPATPRDFMTNLRQTARETDDFLFVYYAGHGLKDDIEDKLYLAVRESDTRELDVTAVDYNWIKRALELENHANTSLLVLDCCFSGMAAGFMSDGEVSKSEIRIRGTAVLASSPRKKVSLSPIGHRHTAFTGKMIDLLSNGSPLENEPLTVNALYHRVSVALAKERLPEPKLALTETSGNLLVRRFAESAKTSGPVHVSETSTSARAPETPAQSPVLTTPAPIQVVTAPTWPTRPAPQPPFDPAPAEPSRSTKWIQLTGLRTLWTLVGIFVPMGLGGLVGVVTGARRPDGTVGDDAAALWIGLGVSIVLGGSLWLMRRRWLLLRRELAPPLITRTVLGCVVVFVGLLFFMALLVAFIAADTSSREYSGSDIMYRVANIVMVSEVAALCGYLLFMRARKGAERPKTPGSRA